MKIPEEFNNADCTVPPLIVYSIFASGDPVNVVTTLSPEHICKLEALIDAVGMGKTTSLKSVIE